MFYEFAQKEENKINIITLQKQFVWSLRFENGKGFEKKNSFSKEGRKKEKKNANMKFILLFASLE